MKGKLFKVLVGTKIINKFDDVLNIFSPINNQKIGSIPKVSTEEQIDDIFRNAKLAFNKYRNVPYQERKKWILEFANLIKKNRNELANLIMWEVAKTKKAATQEVDRSIQYINDTIIEYEKIMSNPKVFNKKNSDIKNKIGTFFLEPVGLVLAISPFNYPLNLLITKIVPALLSGNTVVYKPATQGSCVGALISTLLYKAGFIEGEVSCLIGKGSQIGDIIISHPEINSILFTGSTKVGKKIAQLNPLINVVLEMGGKDAAIVLKDANLKDSAKKIVQGAFDFNGQRCTGIKRVLVDAEVEDKLIKYIDDEIKKLSIGTAKENNPTITEMINIESLKSNLILMLDAYNHGAKTNQVIKAKGNILWPIVIHNVTTECKIAWEEQFGPVLPIISFKTIQEAIEINNQSEYGLQASIFTTNISKAKKEIAPLLEVVTVNINSTPSRSPDIFPFGGIKNSGKGLQGVREAILSVNRVKGIVEIRDK